jgi:two-component system response regulator GlrR
MGPGRPRARALDSATPRSPLDERRAFEREYLARILKITQGNVTQAARLAGLNRTEFYRLLDRHALQPSMFKMSPPSDSENVESSTASRART